MAKFELNVYSPESGEIVKTSKRVFMPVDLFIRFQDFSEKVSGNKYKKDKDFFVDLKELFLELFPDMTEAEYLNQTDVAEVLKIFGEVINKSTEFSAGNSKNV